MMKERDISSEIRGSEDVDKKFDEHVKALEIESCKLLFESRWLICRRFRVLVCGHPACNVTVEMSDGRLVELVEERREAGMTNVCGANVGKTEEGKEGKDGRDSLFIV